MFKNNWVIINKRIAILGQEYYFDNSISGTNYSQSISFNSWKEIYANENIYFLFVSFAGSGDLPEWNL